MIGELDTYRQQLRALRPDRSNGYAKPHKVALMLAVADLIEQGVITDNRIVFNELLKQQFSQRFNQFKHGNDKDDPAQPFFYLESSPFWHHHPHANAQPEYQERIQNRQHGGPGVIARIIDYAYLDDALFDYLKSDITRPELKAALYENIEDFSQRFSRWALALGKSEKTVKNYLGALNNSISNWVNDAGLAEKRLTEINSLNDYRQLIQKAKNLEIFEVRDSKGKGMYSAALKLYDEFLVDTTNQSVEADIQQIQQDPELTDTEKSILTSTRVGQGQYRKNLIDYWQGCAITRYRNPRFLVASHIKPWKDSNNKERLDPFNGLLLLPNLDKAFDLGYISFRETGKVMLSEELDDSGVLGISDEMKIPLQGRHQEYLAFHRDLVFR